MSTCGRTTISARVIHDHGLKLEEKSGGLVFGPTCWSAGSEHRAHCGCADRLRRRSETRGPRNCSRMQVQTMTVQGSGHKVIIDLYGARSMKVGPGRRINSKQYPLDGMVEWEGGAYNIYKVYFAYWRSGSQRRLLNISTNFLCFTV